MKMIFIILSIVAVHFVFTNIMSSISLLIVTANVHEA